MDYNSFPWSYEVTMIRNSDGHRQVLYAGSDKVKAEQNYKLGNDAVGHITLLTQSRAGIVKGHFPEGC